MAVQTAISEVLTTALRSLHLTNTHFNHTGDGYVCSFLGDDSARIIDFVNVMYPALLSRLASYEQEFRGGIAFGLIHLRKNTLTHHDTHFDLPGIEAARLEQGAQPRQILCTLTVHSIFKRHYPNLFGEEGIQVQSKDRVLSAFELRPADSWNVEIRQKLLEFIFRRHGRNVAQRSGILMVVDDDEGMRTFLTRLLMRHYPDHQVMSAATGEEALEIGKDHVCALVVTDIVMPNMSGIDMIREFRQDTPEPIIVGISGYIPESKQKEFFQAGGFLFVTKPFVREEFEQVTTYAMHQPQGQTLRQALSMMCDDVASLLYALHETTGRVNEIMHSVGTGSELALEVLRHKAKHLVNDGLARLGPGVEPVEEIRHLNVRLSSVERLARIMGMWLGVQGVSAFISSLIADLRRIHPDVEFRFEVQTDVEMEGDIHLGGVVVLAITELLDNAVAAVGAGGHISVTIATLRAAGVLQVSVRDDGPGVSPDFEEKMFDENSSTKGVGRGLGLHLVRESTRLLRGAITYDRRNGSEFCVRLPLAPPNTGLRLTPSPPAG
jgi:signal transduction histidine kinase